MSHMFANGLSPMTIQQPPPLPVHAIDLVKTYLLNFQKAFCRQLEEIDGGAAFLQTNGKDLKAVVVFLLSLQRVLFLTEPVLISLMSQAIICPLLQLPCDQSWLALVFKP